MGSKRWRGSQLRRLRPQTELRSDICWALNAKQQAAACLIDLEKAFDTVWMPGLIYKMIKKTFQNT